MCALQKITIARGDGIGPEIMEATLSVLEAAEARLAYDEIEIGKAVYERGVPSGIEESAWESFKETKIFLKAPITTPQGGGFKSLNVTVRKSLGLFANVRPCVSYAPFVRTFHPDMDIVIVRENEEDLYGGIEYRQSEDVMASFKLISRPGTERIVRYAFEYARANGRKKVTCMTKDNIMKITDGLFHQIFDEICTEYPDIESNHMIIDIGSARIASRPHDFDVVVTANLYGDIISDIAAEVSGSIGLAGSLNLGATAAMFEAVHGSAPDIAGQNIANPSGLLSSAIMMLVHLGRTHSAETVHNAWLRTLESGVHTADIYRREFSKELVGTAEFADAVIDNLGEMPQKIPAVSYPDRESIAALPDFHCEPRTPAVKECVGVDVFLNWDQSDRDPEVLGKALSQIAPESGFTLKMVTNRGVKVFPHGNPETLMTDHWRCRFMSFELDNPTGRIPQLLKDLYEAGLDAVKTENLYTFDGEPGYSKAQGEG